MEDRELLLASSIRRTPHPGLPDVVVDESSDVAEYGHADGRRADRSLSERDTCNRVYTCVHNRYRDREDDGSELQPQVKEFSHQSPHFPRPLL